jgi:hypothetical protein
MWSGPRLFLSRLSGHKIVAALLVASVAFACSGRSTTTIGDDDTSGGDGARGGKGGSTSAGTGGSMHVGGKGGTGGSAATGGTGDSGDVPYDDPGCPDAAAPAAVIECNVFDAASGCASGLACKPDIQHPFGSGCDQQVLNMRCVYPGTGQQGDSCEGGMSDCAEGMLCVVGASHGAVCLKMCPLDGSVLCPSGFVCGPTDADGIGVCA